MRRKLPTRLHRTGPTTRGPARWFAFGLRAALLAVLAQVVVNVVHQLPHEHRLDVAAVEPGAAAGDAHDGYHHEDGPPPANHPDTPLCTVGQLLQHLAAALPVASASVVFPDWEGTQAAMPTDTEAAAARPNSPAQPRAPPLTA